MPTPQVLNNAESSLAADYTSGSGTLTLAAGTGPRFGTPTVDAPVRITVVARSTLVHGEVAPTSIYTIYDCTARSGDVLSGLTPVEGTSDRNYRRNDPAAALITAGVLADLQSAVAGAPSDATVVHKTGVETVAGPKTLTDKMLAHRAQPITSGLDDDVALTVSQTRADGTDPGMDPGFPAPVGNIAIGTRNPAREGTPYRWQWYVSDDGQMSTSSSIQISQERRLNGSIIGCYGPGVFDLRSDGNFSCMRAENTLSGQPNGYCYGALDRSAADPRDTDGPYSQACGKLKWAIGPSGEEWRGTWLQEDPEANRLSKVWLSTATGNLTFESSLSATTTTVDIARPSTAGVGVTELVVGRSGDGSADLRISAASSAASTPVTSFIVSTVSGERTAMQFISRLVDGTASALVKAPILGLGSSIKFTTDNGDGTGTVKAAFGTAGNLVLGASAGNYLLTLAGASRGGVYLGIPATTSVADGDIINYANLGGPSFAGTVTGFLYSIDSSAAFTSTFKNGRSTSTAANAILELATQSANGGSPFTMYTIAGVRNVCVGIDNADGDKWKVTYGYPVGAGTDAITVDTTGNFTAAGSMTAATTFKVAGTQVVGARLTAVADATGAGDVVAQLNALLARLRTHGLIAP